MTETRAPMVVVVDDGPEHVRVEVRGEIDFRDTERLVELASGPLRGQQTARILVLDLAGVTYCDSVGIAALVRIRRACDAAGWRLVVAPVSPIVQRLLDVTGLSRWFDSVNR